MDFRYEDRALRFGTLRFGTLRVEALNDFIDNDSELKRSLNSKNIDFKARHQRVIQMTSYRNPPKSKYKTYISQFKEILSEASATGITLWHGGSDYLVSRSTQAWQQAVTKTGLTVDSVNATDLTEESFFSLLSQGSLFTSNTGVLIRRCEMQPALPRWLKKVTAISKPVALVYYKEKLPAHLKKELTRLKAKSVVCENPTDRELPAVITALGKKRKLPFDSSAVALITEAIGNDLGQIDSEIEKIQFALHNQSDTSKALTAADISPFVGTLRQDHAFTLDRMLINHQYSRAQLLLENLLKRGSAPLQILGILTLHCRLALSIAELMDEGVASSQLGQKIKMQPWKIRNYLPYVRKTPANRIKAAMRSCYDADRALKSSKISPYILLPAIIDNLRA